MSRPVAEPLKEFEAARAIGIQDKRRRQRPVALHIHAANKMFKGCVKGIIVSKELRMLEFDRGHNRQPRMIVPEVVIEFVGLVHKVLALAQAIVGIEARDDGPHLARGIKAGIDEHQRE